MKPEQQRIALAEWDGWDGWEDVAMRFVGDECSIGAWMLCSGEIGKGGREVPDFLNDLNAVRVLAMNLTIDQTRDYLYELERATFGKASDFSTLDEAMSLALLVNASAAQRCEALLKTLGLWREEA